MSRYLNSPREADWFACPTCGDEVRVGSSGCQKCRGTQPGDPAQDPEDFDYDDWQKREFGASSKIKPHHLPWKYWLAGILLVAAMIWSAVLAGFLRH